MSDAKKCDACEALMQTEGTVEIETLRLLVSKNRPNPAWGDADDPLHICRGCLNRPMHEVLAKMCDGFFDEYKRGERVP